MGIEINNLPWRYQAIRPLGQGQYGMVVLALDRLSGDQVVLKMADRPGVAALKNEFIRLHRLGHPGLPAVYDLSLLPGGSAAFLAMERCPGQELLWWLERDGLGRERAIEVFFRLVRALSHLHRRQLAHGDLKPENVMVSETSVKLLDLGLAARGGNLSGTPAYASPESLAGRNGISPASDIYSLGLIFHQMLTGRLPTLEERLNRSQEPMAGNWKGLDDPIAELLSRMLRYDPLDRPGDASALLEEGHRLGLIAGDDDLPCFAYHAPRRALGELLDRLNSPGITMLSGESGSGKTSLLQELKFIWQLRGKPAYYLDASRVPIDSLGQFGFEPGSPLLIDNLPSLTGETAALAGTGHLIWAGCSGTGTSKLNCHQVEIESPNEAEYRRMIGSGFPGLSSYDRNLLARLVGRQAGADMRRAREWIAHLAQDRLIRSNWGVMAVDWPNLPEDPCLPQGSQDQLEAWYGSLSDQARSLANDVSLGRLASDVRLPPEIAGKVEEISGRWSWRDDQTLGLVMSYWPSSLRNELSARLEAGPKDGYFYRDPYRRVLPAGLAKRALTAQALEISLREGDLHRARRLARQLLEGSEPSQLAELAEKLSGICARLGRWGEAAEALALLESERSGRWDYWRRLFYLLINAGMMEEAGRKAALIAGHSGDFSPEIVMLSRCFAAYLKGLSGQRSAGLSELDYCRQESSRMGLPRAVAAAALELGGALAYQDGQWAAALARLEESASLWDQSAEGYQKLRVLALSGNAHRMLGNLEQARLSLEAAATLADSQLPDQTLGKVYYSLGAVHYCRMDWPRAEEAFRASLSHSLTTGGGQRLEEARLGLANLELKKGNLRAARDGYAELAVRWGREHNDRSLLGCLINLALAEGLLGQQSLADLHLDRALKLSGRQGSGYQPGAVPRARGGLELERGNWPAAAEHLRQALRECQPGQSAPDPEVLADLAYAEHRMGQAETAQGLFKQAIGLYPVIPMVAVRLKRVEGILMMTEPSQAAKGLETTINAGSELMKQGDRFYAANSWLQGAEEAIRQGVPDLAGKALPWLVRAEGEFSQMGAEGHLQRAREAIVQAARSYFGQPSSGEHSPELLAGIYQLAESLATEADQPALARQALRLAVEGSGAERGAIFLLDDSGRITLGAQLELDEQTQKDALEFSASAVQAASQQGRTIISNDASLDQAFRSRLSVQRNVIRSLLCVPLSFREGAAGALYLDSRVSAGLFGQGRREFVTALAGIIGAVLESGKMMGRLRGGAGREDDLSELIIGRSPAVQRMISRIRSVAGAEVTVLLDGESGSGKEMAAQAVHRLSARGRNRFVALDCGSLPETLLESELFGYAKGAFTGAGRDKLGLFEAANGGTVFLDEISSASQAVQSRLLRVLESGEIRRVGESEPRTVDVRVICATNRDLEIEINQGRFREDLYYRLKVVTIPVPPLREREEDILLLAEYFKERYCRKFGKIGLRFDSRARQQLLAHSWPGNIRELDNAVQRAVLLAQGRSLTARDLEISPEEVPEEDSDLRQQLEIRKQLSNFDGNVTQAAKAMGISRRHFYRLMDKYGIKP